MASVSAAYNSRYEDGTVAFDNIRTRMKPVTGVESCRGNGFGCVMLRISILSEYIFTHRGPTNDYDPNFYDWLNRYPNCNGVLVDYNHHRRHSAMDHETPAAFAARSVQQDSATLRPVEQNVLPEPRFSHWGWYNNRGR